MTHVPLVTRHLYNVVIPSTRCLKRISLVRRVNVSPSPFYITKILKNTSFSFSNPLLQNSNTTTLSAFVLPHLSELPNLYIFTPNLDRIFTRGNYSAGVKGSSQFSNPFEQSARADSRIGRRGKPPRG